MGMAFSVPSPSSRWRTQKPGFCWEIVNSYSLPHPTVWPGPQQELLEQGSTKVTEQMEPGDCRAPSSYLPLSLSLPLPPPRQFQAPYSFLPFLTMFVSSPGH